MKLTFTFIGAAVLVAVTATGLAAAGGDGDEAADGPADSATQQERFVGISLDDAAALAETEGRLWRVAREDDTDFALTSDLNPGRLTFEVDDGIVTSAQIERPSTDPPAGEEVIEDPARAALIAAAALRLVTFDNSFGGADVFDDIRVARTVGSDGSPLAPLDLELIAGTLSDLGIVRFIYDPDAEIATLFDASPAGVAVVAVERIDLFDDRAEIELRLWCGSLCGVYLTYGAAPVDGGWEITGTIGPIAVS